MNLKFLNLWSMLSLLYMQFSAAVPNNLFQRNDNNQTKTEMIEACRRGHLEPIKLLVKKGANINASGDNGLTPLMEAACYGHFSIVKYLVSKGADMNARADDGSTAVRFAASNRHWEIVYFLKTCMLYKEEVISSSGIRLPVSD